MPHPNAINRLLELHERQGYLSIATITDALSDSGISLYDVEYACNQLLSMGVFICDAIDARADDDEQGRHDRSQIDYDQVYEEVLSIDAHLTSFIEEVRRIRAPQHRELMRLIPQAKRGNRLATQRLVEMYLRTVVKIALDTHKMYGVPLAEVIQDGCIGLLVALRKYSLAKNGSFRSYFPWWVTRVVCRRMPFPRDTPFSLPVAVRNRLRSVYSQVAHHECEACTPDGFCPELEARIADTLRCSPRTAQRYLGYFQASDSIERILDDEPETLSDSGAIAEEILEACCLRESRIHLDRMLDTLSQRERHVLELRFGLSDGAERTLDWIGTKLGLTRERIRQIEKRALRKLRHLVGAKLRGRFEGVSR